MLQVLSEYYMLNQEILLQLYFFLVELFSQKNKLHRRIMLLLPVKKAVVFSILGFKAQVTPHLRGLADLLLLIEVF